MGFSLKSPRFLSSRWGPPHKDAAQARISLIQTSLILSRAERLDMLSPIRDHAIRRHPARPKEKALISDHYVGLIRKHAEALKHETVRCAAIDAFQEEFPNLKATMALLFKAGHIEAATSAFQLILEIGAKHRGLGIYQNTIRNIGSIASLIAKEKPSPQEASLLASAYKLMASIYSDLDQLDTLERFVRKAERAMASTGETASDVELVLLFIGSYRRRGENDKAAGAYENLIVELRNEGRMNEVACVLDCLGHIKLAQGHPELAAEQFRKAISLTSNPIDIGIFHGNTGKALYRQGMLEEAQSEVDLSIAALRGDREDGGHPRRESYSYRIRGDILVAQGNIEDARRAYVKASAIAEEIESPHCAAMAHVGLGRWQLLFGDAAKAETTFGMCKVFFTQVEDKSLEAESLAGLSLSLHAPGKGDAVATMAQAYELLQRAADLYAEGWVRASSAALLNHRGNASRGLAEEELSEAAFRSAAPSLLGMSQVLLKRLI